MCHEMWSKRLRERAHEEGREIWDLFDRETRDEPPQPVADTKRPAEEREPVMTEPVRR